MFVDRFVGRFIGISDRLLLHVLGAPCCSPLDNNPLPLDLLTDSPTGWLDPILESVCSFLDLLASNITGHNDNCIFEIYRPAMAVG